MEDSVGNMLFENECLNDQDFSLFVSSLSKPLGDREKFKKICEKTTRFYSDGSEQAKKMEEYLRKNFPQPFITNPSPLKHGIYLDVEGIGLRKTIRGKDNIMVFVDIVKSYKEKHESPDAPFDYNTAPLFP